MQNTNPKTDNETAKNSAVLIQMLLAAGRIDHAAQDMADAQMRLDDATSNQAVQDMADAQKSLDVATRNLRSAMQDLAALNGLTVTHIGRDDLDIPDLYPYAQELIDVSDDPRDHVLGRAILNLWRVAHIMRKELAPHYIATR